MKKSIEIMKLRKEYGSLTAVKDLTLSVEEGMLFGLLGVNGAGKTTTIKMLTGLAAPTSGDATICGKSISHDLDSVKRIVNVSTQESAVAGKLTVRENLEFIAGIYGMDRKTIKPKVDKMLDSMGLREVEGKRAKTLSGGYQRRLSIAMALITEPKVLFLDEPTLGLDVLARRELWKVIEALKGKVTIVLTTHYLEEAAALSDRIAVMVKGELRAEGTLDEILTKTGKTNLEDAFVALAE